MILVLICVCLEFEIVKKHLPSEQYFKDKEPMACFLFVILLISDKRE